MRTTLSLDEDVFTFARAHARRERISIGEALSRLARQGIQAQNLGPKAAPRVSSKYALLPARAEVITSEHVRQLMDQEGI
jgi:hypothetical protein